MRVPTGCFDTVTRAAPNGNSVTIQQRFTSGGAAVPAGDRGGWDFIVSNVLCEAADGQLAVGRALKFCRPKGVRMTKENKAQLQKCRAILMTSAEIIQPR